MDLGKFDENLAFDDGAVFTVRDVGGNVMTADGKPDGKPLTIKLAGVDSERYRNAERAGRQKRTEMIAAGRWAPDLQDAERINIMAACFLSWDGFEIDGKPAECSLKNAKLLLSKSRRLQDDVEAFIVNRANFLRG